MSRALPVSGVGRCQDAAGSVGDAIKNEPREHTGRLEYGGRGRPRPEVDLRSAGLRCLWAAAGGPAPKGGAAGSASAKVPSAAWPRNASERQQEEA